MNSDNLNLLQPVVPADSVTANNGPGMEQRAVPAEVPLDELRRQLAYRIIKARSSERLCAQIFPGTGLDKSWRDIKFALVEFAKDIASKPRSRGTGGNA